MHRKTTSLVAAACGLALLVGGPLGFRAWRVSAMARQERLAFACAESLLKDGKPAEALGLVQSFANRPSQLPWPHVEIQALTALLDLPRLAAVFDRTPNRILEDEAASVLMARAFLQARKPAEFTRIRGDWRGREQHLDAWLALEADALLVAGKPREAEQLLRKSKLPGETDGPRLVRLALLSASRDLSESWKLLGQAAALDPKNPEIRTFRGQILERLGRLELARVEYVAALVASPQNPLLRDQLAEFYVRTRNQDLALDTWAEALRNPGLDFLELKAQFWNRVLRPVKLPAQATPASGELVGLTRYIEGLPPGQFFDAHAFAQLPRAEAYTAQRPEVLWLRLLDALQHQQEAAALDLLKFESTNLRAWDPDLAAALTRILHYREKQSLNPPGLKFVSDRATSNRPAFFVELEQAARQPKTALTPELAALLRGTNAFAAAFLAAGWREAALQLRGPAGSVAAEPEWVILGFAQALRANRDPQAALTYLGQAPLPPAAALLRAEVWAETGRRQDAVREFQTLAKLNAGVGFRAAILLALDAAEQKQFAEARRFIEQQPLLAQADTGKEILARLALAEGKPAEAEQIYRGMLQTSVEAKAWFARRAFADKRWQDARRLTNELLELLPDSVQLRENLLAIDQAEGRR